MLNVIDIYEYFLGHISDKKSVMDMLNELCPDELTVSKDDDGMSTMDLGLVVETDKICTKMSEDSFLLKLKTDFFVGNNQYVGIDARSGKSKEALANNKFDCKYRGFTFTRQLYLSSVKPIDGINKKDNPDIGTAFKVGSNVFATARHCVTDLKSFRLLGENDNPIPLKEVVFPKNENLDIALLITEKPVDGKEFTLAEPQVLEDVLVMGYPPITGLLPFLVCEKGQMAADMKSAIGANVGESKDYLKGLDSFLISARVKGGSSGSPVVNEYGEVCGIVVSLPVDSNDSDRIDLMGYGVCLPSKYIEEMLKGENVIKQQLNKDYKGKYFL